MKRLILVSLLLASAGPVAAKPPARPEMIDYAVRKGDNLYTLAERYFRRVGDYAIVRRLNRVADPYRLPVGRILRIPRRLLREEPVPARIEAFSGPVRVVTAGGSSVPAVGMTADEASRIETGANAFVSVRLADGSTVSIPSQSRVTIRRMRKLLLTGAVERQFDIDSGRLRAVVTPMTNPTSSFRVTTPVAVAAVRGTQFQVGYDPARGTDATEVLEGTVGVSAAETRSAAALLVPAGFGTVTAAGRAGSLVKLLPAPALDDPGRIQNERELAFAIRPLGGASAYHVEVARDGDLLDRIEEAQSATPVVTLPSVPSGTYFVRIAAIDAQGLEGLPAVYGFERRLNRVEGSMESGGGRRDRRYLFRWYSEGEGTRQFRFQLSTHPDGSAPIIDEIGLTGNQIAVTNLPSGDYYWRVMSVQFVDGKAQGAWMPLHQFHIQTR